MTIGETRPVSGRLLRYTTPFAAATLILTAACSANTDTTSAGTTDPASGAAASETFTGRCDDLRHVLLPGSTHTERVQFALNTFCDFRDASGVSEEKVPVGTDVTVDCVATGPEEAAPTTHGRWYHMTGPAEYAGRFASANSFENGSTDGPLEDQPAVDPNVPECPEIPPIR